MIRIVFVGIRRIFLADEMEQLCLVMEGREAEECSQPPADQPGGRVEGNQK